MPIDSHRRYRRRPAQARYSPAIRVPSARCERHIAEALRALALPHAVHVETVGFGIERCDGLRAMDEQHPAKLLQEIRSTIRAADALLESLPASEPAPLLAR
ncbi:hypothetical protein ACFVFQ_07200 [Streptomyces sp. NPDC057743]|uniref:hypothetical protein n=1 Tax=Streptomyces sp. NPDC057743 TaxID=3346236 RepID=UPI0036BB6EFC